MSESTNSTSMGEIEHINVDEVMAEFDRESNGWFFPVCLLHESHQRLA